MVTHFYTASSLDGFIATPEHSHQEKWEYAQPTFVFTHREPPVPAGADGRIVSGDVAELFKEEGRPLLPRSLQLELVDTARNRDFVCARYRMARRTET